MKDKLGKRVHLPDGTHRLSYGAYQQFISSELTSCLRR